MKFDAFKTDKYWNKFRKNEIGVVNAMNNYFQNQRSKLTDNFLPSSPRYQFTSFLQENEIRTLRKIIEGKSLTSQDTLYLKKSITFNTNNQISMKKLFEFYLEYLKKGKKIDKLTLNGVIVNKIIKPFLSIIRQLQVESQNIEVSSLNKKEIMFQYFDAFNRGKHDRCLLLEEDEGDMYFRLLNDHVKKYEDKDNIKEKHFKNAFSFDFQEIQDEKCLKDSRNTLKNSSKKKFNELEDKLQEAGSESLSFQLQLLKDKADKILYNKK